LVFVIFNDVSHFSAVSYCIYNYWATKSKSEAYESSQRIDFVILQALNDFFG